MDMGFPAERTHFLQVSIKLAQFRPQNCGHEFYGHEDFSERMEFRIPRVEFQIPRTAPRIPRNSPRAPRMALHSESVLPENGVVPRLLKKR